MSKGLSFLARTGQAWKLRVAFLVAALSGAVSWVLGHRSLELPDAVAGFLLTINTLGGFSALVWVANSVRCPAYGAPLLWMAVRNRPITQWLGWLDSLLLCPICGSSGDQDVTPNKAP